jgi:hypothetical protein
MLIEELLVKAETGLRSGLLATSRTHFEGLFAEVAKERAEGLAELAKERAKLFAELAKGRAKGLAEVAKERADLHREIEAMQKHKEAQSGCVVLNVGGHRFESSVQVLRRIPHTFFDAYFSGRYAQDVCNGGRIFIDRDGTHFGHVLEYMRDGVVAVAEPGAHPSVSLVRALKREFGFYCIELVVAGQPAEPERPMAYIMGGLRENGDDYEDDDDDRNHSSMERFDALTGMDFGGTYEISTT